MKIPPTEEAGGIVVCRTAARCRAQLMVIVMPVVTVALVFVIVALAALV